ncbi:hypothetical protein AAFN47_26890 [Hoeflea sp. CAU 1731]
MNLKGFKTITHIGTTTGAAGSNRALHAYLTNDDAAAVETSDYFNDLSDRLKVGDIILASLDLDGSPALKNYIVTDITSGAVTIAAQTVA